jgi:histidinol phosphatase-like enzyme (inositol monophosphatase family)
MASMPSPVDPELLDAAVTIIRKAGALTLEHFRHPELDIIHKGDGTPVTIADREAERFVREQLEELFPDDGILGEEEAEKIGTSGRRWILDPIDGTKAFTRGVPLYTNLLALEDEDGISVGVINVPALDETVAAGRGLGCFANGVRVSVNDRPSLDGGCISTSGFNIWSDEAMLRVKRSGVQLRTWGDGYGYVLVATGRIEAMVDPVAELYDLAPMPIILAEAGGRFTSYAGEDGPGHGSGVASNGKVHDDVLALLRD